MTENIPDMNALDRKESAVNMPVLSVIVPVYNREAFLPQCLDRLFAMKGVSKEVIVVNDGSNDGSRKIMEDYCQRFPTEMVVIHQENGGVSKARNAGITVAKGGWIAFVDSDDLVDSDAMVALVKKAELMGLDVIAGRAKTFGEGGDEILPVPKKLFDLPPLKGKEYLDIYYANASVEKKDFRPEACFMLYHASLLREHNVCFEEGVAHEDELFTPSVLLVAKAVKMCDAVFYLYRQHGASIMHQVNEKQRESKAIVAIKLVQQLKKHSVSQKFVNNRIVGWCKEGKEYLCFSQMMQVVTLRNFGWKDSALLCVLVLLSILRSCKADSGKADERRDAER